MAESPGAVARGGAETAAAPFHPLAGSATVSQAELRHFAAAIGDRVYFGLDSHALDGDAQTKLDRQAEWLLTRPTVRIMVAGHADERGTREYNLALGSRRAAAAQGHLIRRGVPAARIETVSYGKEKPVDDRSNEDGWARNRNAQSILLNGQPLS
jgi:peptidoglycan-associated lipoprotein